MAAPADLEGIDLFDGLAEDELAELAGWFDDQTVGTGVRLISEGASGYSFYVLLAGRAAVSEGEERLGTLAPGDFFGEIAILGAGGRRTATVTTTEPSRLLVMFGTEFRRLEAAHPAIAAQLEQAMRERVGVTET
jgi:CRP-like cAMP-binding protein